MRPLILINFKEYKEAVGNKSLELARTIAKVNKPNYKIVVTPSLLNLKEIVDKTSLNVYSQHADPVSLGAQTGHVSIEELKMLGVKGTLLNHSERKMPFPILKKAIEMCKSKKMKVVVCASTLSEIKKIALLNPNFIAYEPKELIGTNISVTESKPDIIIKAVELVKEISPKTKVLCGAGIHTKEDLGHALLLGTKGVLIGHAVPKSKDPKKFLQEMLI
jgi:triosephosphate isomerase (TIM)